MMTKIYSTLTLILLAFTLQIHAQVYNSCNCPCNMGYFNTGLNHTLIFNTTVVNLDGVPILSNSTQQVLVGVYYDSLGTLTNAGYINWDGTPGAIAAWQAEPGIINGFSSGEEIQWKVCVINTQTNTSQTYNATAIYTLGLPNSGFFATNGISAITTINAVSEQTINAPDWNYSITAGNHTILIPSSANPQIDGQNLMAGDYIGVFYDSLGTLTCAGYVQWTGANTAITAWGSDVGNDGFASGELFKWKVWQLYSGNTIQMSATYGTSFPNAGNYATNGISGLIGLSGNSLNLDEILSPVSDCNLGNESITVRVENPNPDPINKFTLGYKINGSNLISETYTQTIAPGASYDFTFSTTINLTATGTYQLVVYKGANDSLSTQIINENNQVFLSMGDNAFCINTTPVSYQLQPSTAWINGTGILNGFFHPSVAGIGQHWIHFGNAGSYNCPVEDSMLISVNALPQISITPVDPPCINGSPINLTASPAGGTFSGQGVTNSTFNPIAGTTMISYTYTDQNGCTATANATIQVLAPIAIQISGLSSIYCADDDPVNFTTNAIVSGVGVSGQNGNYTFDPALSVAGTQYLSFSLDNGACNSFESLPVTVIDTPQVNIGNDALIGANQFHTLDAGSGFSTYLWSNGSTSQTVNLNTSGLYKVTVSNNFGCHGVSNTIQLTVAPWGNHLSGINHSILVPESASMLIGNEQIAAGDFIGVFFDDNGIKKCGGWIQWNGVTSGISAWGDDSTTPQKDGFADNEAFEWRIYDQSTGDEYVAFATYSGMFFDGGFYVTNGISGITGLLTSFTQTLNIPSGWSLISTYIEPFNPAVASLFAPNVNNVNILKNGTGQIYWPAYSVNMINNLIVGQGYQLNAFNPFNQDITGMKLNPSTTPIQLPSGWNLIAYLRTSPMDIGQIMNPIVNDIIIVKNDVGQIYWPQFGVNMIGNMFPGKGYQIKLSAAATLTYPAN